MSWRTQGYYRGLSAQEIKWLRRFDRKWDTAREGRSRTDAFDHLQGAEYELENASSEILFPFFEDQDPAWLEQLTHLKIAEIKQQIAKLTVPIRMKTGWSVRVMLECGKRIRMKFIAQDEAMAVYSMLSID